MATPKKANPGKPGPRKPSSVLEPSRPEDGGPPSPALGLDQHPRPSRAVEALPRAAVSGIAAAVVEDQHRCAPTRIRKTGANGDETRYKGAGRRPSYIGNFHKGLPHNEFGEVERDAYRSLLNALDKGRDFDDITLGLGRKLTNPQSGLATDVEGPDPKSLEMLAAPRLDSAEEAAEGVELYWMALLRDAPFTDFATDPRVAEAAQELSGLQEFTGPKVGG